MFVHTNFGLRYAFQFIVFFGLNIWKYGNDKWLDRAQRTSLIIYCATTGLAIICLYKAIRMLPLSDIRTISMCSLVFIAILAYYMLNDPITMIHIGTCILTFVGIVIICRPQFIFGANHVPDNNKQTMGIIITVISTFCNYHRNYW